MQIGTDILDKKRIAKMLQNHGARLAHKILHRDEWQDYCNCKDKTRFLSMRWAAKEALAKALGCGLRAPLLMVNIRVAHDAQGAPFFILNQDVKSLITAKGFAAMHLSLSDERRYVLAFVIAKKNNELTKKS